MKFFLMIFFAFLCFVNISAQEVKTVNGNRLQQIETSIIQVEKNIKEKEAQIQELQTKYSENHPEVKEQKSELFALNKKLIALESEKKQLISQQLIQTLPNSQIELLKIIIQQNEKIIDLLENMKSMP